MTAEQLAEIEARANAATSGPWVHPNHRPDEMGLVYTAYPVNDAGARQVADSAQYCDASDVANADFIAHARSDVPALVAEARRLRESLRHYECIHGHTWDDHAIAEMEEDATGKRVRLCECRRMADAAMVGGT